jgi:RNA polymerase sigma factor (sigma-70 family)
VRDFVIFGPLELRLHNALVAWCGTLSADAALDLTARVPPVALDVDALVTALFRAEGTGLVRLARLFVDDRNAAEDLVQEAFIRFARHAHRLDDMSKAPAYLRSIVLNLARDHNRRGLVSMRHRLPLDPIVAASEDELIVREDQRRLLDALRDLPRRQQACLVLRYYDELGIDDIAETLGVSRNSVKTHLQRGLAALETLLAEPVDA